MKINNLNDVLVHEIKDLFSTENQIIAALPKMSEAAHSTALKTAFEEHLAETEKQVERLEEVSEILEINPDGPMCKGMEGLLKETIAEEEATDKKLTAIAETEVNQEAQEE